MKSYYDELEVSRNASPEIINKAYKVLAKKYHPDTTTENKEEAEERFKKISEAYEILSNEQKKSEYDNSLQPEININDYNKLLADNKKLATELLNLKSQIDNLNHNTNNNYSSNNINNNYNEQNINNSYNQNINNSYNPNPRATYNKVYYTNRQNSNSYSFMDILKSKLQHLFKNILAFILTISLIFIIFSLLLYIPYTRNFILNDLNFGVLFNFFN